MALFALNSDIPSINPTAWIDKSASVIGKVNLEADVSIWPCAVLRGDLDPISVGEGSNIQDNACLHTATGCPCVVGKNVTVGHGAILHGCTVGDGALIGMGAIVLNGAVIGEGAVVGAGALVAEGKTVPAGALVVGTPARFVKTLTPEQIALNLKNTRHYVSKKEEFRTGLREIA